MRFQGVAIRFPNALHRCQTNRGVPGDIPRSQARGARRSHRSASRASHPRGERVTPRGVQATRTSVISPSVRSQGHREVHPDSSPPAPRRRSESCARRRDGGSPRWSGRARSRRTAGPRMSDGDRGARKRRSHVLFLGEEQAPRAVPRSVARTGGVDDARLVRSRLLPREQQPASFESLV